MTKKADLAVFIGRFQPYHNGHHAIVEEAYRKKAARVLVLVGSAYQPRTPYNPFTFEEREEVIRSSFSGNANMLDVRPLKDHMYNDTQWVTDVQTAVSMSLRSFGLDEETADVRLIGHSKDKSSYYLKLFPKWGKEEVAGVTVNSVLINATDIRRQYWDGFGIPWRGCCPFQTAALMLNFSVTDHYKELCEEVKFIRAYKDPYKYLPYPPIFSTVDACVVQAGHVLLVKRRARPGKGLWALPGGFVNQDETLAEATIRELLEETRIRVPKAVLRGSVVKREIFDHPNRSSRGRTITTTTLICLEGLELPKIKGSDDAEKAAWVPLAKVDRREMYEDHYHQIAFLTGAL